MTSSVYSAGTVSVSNGSATVTGTGTAWQIALVSGGMFSFAGLSVPIASVESDTSLTLAYPWPGAAASGSYAIARETSEAVRAAWINDRLAQILTRLSLAGIHPDGAGTLAERNALSPAPAASYLWLRVETGYGLDLYKRTASGWDGPFSLKGDQGTAGADAVGLKYTWDAGVAAGDPGAGKVRVNNATLASATALYISESDADAAAIAAYLATWDDSTATIKGTLRIIKRAAPSTFAVYSITGAMVDNGAWNTFTIAYVASSGSLASGDSVRLEFSRTGNNGGQGNVGPTGPGVGVTLAYSTTTADADPGNGTFRFNNATIASATAAYIDNVDSTAASITAWLDTLDDSTNTVKGTLVLRGITTAAAFAVFDVTGSVFDGTGYRKVALVHKASGGAWTNGNSFALNFSRAGDKGTDGVGAGDMLKATYDPTGKNADAFAMANMVEDTSAKVMTAAERTKLAGIAVGAQVNTVTSVAGKAGAVTLAKGDVGLGNVDNTADANKPVSTATQTALDGKASIGAVREKLTANRIYYVRTDGSNSNSGLLNTAGGAFPTMQKAWDTLLTADLNGFSVTIKLGNSGTYTSGLTAVGTPVGGNVIIEGDTATPANTIISVTNGHCIAARAQLTLTVQYLEMRTITAGCCLFAEGAGARIDLGPGLRFGVAADYHLRAISGGYVYGAGQSYTVLAAAQQHYAAALSGIIELASTSVTVSGSPAWTQACANATGTGVISLYSMTFTGAATGKRYDATLGGIIQVYGAGASYIPGSVAGTTATGGQYA